jgi:hypothetical protein
VDLLWICLYRTVDNIIWNLIDEAAKHDKGGRAIGKAAPINNVNL